VTIGLVFAISSFGKVRNIQKFKQAILHFQLLPSHLSYPLAVLFLSGELAVVLFVIIGGPLLLPGFILATLLLLIFCGALASILVRRIQTACNCFGSNEKNVSYTDLWRNLGFILCASLGYETLIWTQGAPVRLGGVEWLLTSLGALVFVLIWIELGEIVQLFRPN